MYEFIINIVQWSNFVLCLRALQSHMTGSFWPVLAYWLYINIYEHVYFNCSMRHWTDTVFIRTFHVCQTCVYLSP